MTHSVRPIHTTTSLQHSNDFLVLYESEELLVLHKPFDVAMDGAEHTATVKHWASTYIELNASSDPANPKGVRWVHQLDAATSGVLLVALTRPMAARLIHCFEMREVQKEYEAIVFGNLLRTLAKKRNLMENGQRSTEETAFVPFHIHCPIGYDETDPTDFAMKLNGSQPRDAHTELIRVSRAVLPVTVSCELLTLLDTLETKPVLIMGEDAERNDKFADIEVSFVKIRLHTGRRHQIRLHLSSYLGHPIVGDITYGGDIRCPGSPENCGTHQTPCTIFSHLHLLSHSIGLPNSTLAPRTPLRERREKAERRRIIRRYRKGLSPRGRKDLQSTPPFEQKTRFQSPLSLETLIS